MSIEKARDTYKDVLKTASKFLSPSIRSYFEIKAKNDFETIQKSSKSDVLNFIEEQKMLNQQLSNVVDIYNRYRDDSTTL